jgi:hypothetical protein
LDSAKQDTNLSLLNAGKIAEKAKEVVFSAKEEVSETGERETSTCLMLSWSATQELPAPLERSRDSVCVLLIAVRWACKLAVLLLALSILHHVLVLSQTWLLIQSWESLKVFQPS